MKTSYWIITAFVLFHGNPLSAQSYKNEFGFVSDNDSYLAQGSDRYYTNGLFIQFRHAVQQDKLKAGLEKKIYEIYLGQKMYNPISGYSPDPNSQDRPFAGYLFAGTAFSWLNKNERVIKASFEIGTTGPNSLAEKGQEFLHRTIGFYKPEGWKYQIANEFTFNSSFQYKRLISRSQDQKVDVIFDGYINAGSVFDGVGAGVLFRAGDLNQLFNSSSTNSVVGNHPSMKTLVKREIYFYGKPQINYVIFDATVQGSLFNNDSPVTFDTKPLVFTQQLGFNYSSQRFTFDFAVLFKTREIKSKARAHQYGTITMFYRFN